MLHIDQDYAANECFANITGAVYQMSIDLTTQALLIQNLSQLQKHILTILCFRANQNNEVYSTIERLALDCTCNIKTVERALKYLRDNNYLQYTGKIAPKSKNIPIYSINLNHGLSVGDKSLTTDSVSSNHGLSVLLTTHSESIWIDHINKDNKKDISSSSHAISTPKTQKERTPNGIRHISDMFKILN